MNLLIKLIWKSVSKYLESNPDFLLDVLVSVTRRFKSYEKPLWIQALAAGADYTVTLALAVRDGKLTENEILRLKNKAEEGLAIGQKDVSKRTGKSKKKK